MEKERYRSKTDSPIHLLRNSSRSQNSLTRSQLGGRNTARTASNFSIAKPFDPENEIEYEMNRKMSKSAGSANRLNSGENIKKSQSSININHSISPAIRSKSSYSYHFSALMNSLHNLETTNISNVGNSNSSISPQPMKSDIDNPQGVNGFLHYLECKGFHGIWGHPVAKLYFLMYLIWHGYDNLLLLRTELLDYRDAIFKNSSQTARINFYKKIKKSYFSEGSPFYIEWPENIVNPTIDELMEQLASVSDQCPITMYDDLAFVTMQTLEMIYHNQRIVARGITGEPINRTVSKNEGTDVRKLSPTIEPTPLDLEPSPRPLNIKIDSKILDAEMYASPFGESLQPHPPKGAPPTAFRKLKLDSKPTIPQSSHISASISKTYSDDFDDMRISLEDFLKNEEYHTKFEILREEISFVDLSKINPNGPVKAISESDFSNVSKSNQKLITMSASNAESVSENNLKRVSDVDEKIETTQKKVEYSFQTAQTIAFLKSGFYQAMKADLLGTAHLTDAQCIRAIERVWDICNCSKLDSTKYEVIGQYLEDLKLDFDDSFSPRKKAPHLRTLTEEPTISKSSNKLNILYLSDGTAVEHTFIKAENQGEDAFCEYCLKIALQDNLGELQSCATCRFTCHKYCRNLSNVSCVSTNIENDFVSPNTEGGENIIQIQESLQALQREVDIELRIQEGLERMVKAKVENKKKSKKNSTDKDLASQLERNSKKLEVLKHEIQKRKAQIQTLQKYSEKENTASNLNARHGPAGNIVDTGLLRVTIIDPTTKSELKKAVYVKENQSTIEVIEMILNKANLIGKPTAYNLSYKDRKDEVLNDEDHNGDEIILKDENRPMQLEDVNYAETMFYLRVKPGFENGSSGTFKKKHNDQNSPENDPLLNKQLEIVMEIIESEAKYLEDLHLIKRGFIDPLVTANLISTSEREVMFSNINEIISLHESLGEDINIGLPEMTKDTVENTIMTFAKHLNKFDSYATYCSNQYAQKAFWKEKEANLAFSKHIQFLEKNPSLHKLHIADMLMKPMQKITRYPLLFKRLLPNLVTDSPIYLLLENLLEDLEKIIGIVNQKAREMQAIFKMKMLDNELDFAGVAEKYRFCCQDRSLLQETSLKYLNKNGSYTDVVIFLFSDHIIITKRKLKSESSFLLYKAPIPLESAVIIDKIDRQGFKNAILIAHRQFDLHELHAYSAFDKNMWLVEAEAARNRFCSAYLDYESIFMKPKLLQYHSHTATIENSQTELNSTSSGIPHNASFRNRKTINEIDLNDERTSNVKLNRKQTFNGSESKGTKLMLAELIAGKKERDSIASVDGERKGANQKTIIQSQVELEVGRKSLNSPGYQEVNKTQSTPMKSTLQAEAISRNEKKKSTLIGKLRDQFNSKSNLNQQHSAK